MRHFPTAKRFLGIPVREQADAIRSEASEVYLAVVDEDSVKRTAEETWDTIQACETMLAILGRYTDVDAIRDQVEAKNRGRGYYEGVSSTA